MPLFSTYRCDDSGDPRLRKPHVGESVPPAEGVLLLYGGHVEHPGAAIQVMHVHMRLLGVSKDRIPGDLHLPKWRISVLRLASVFHCMDDDTLLCTSPLEL